MLQKLIYSIFIFCLHNFLIFTFFIFRIIFERTCYGTTVVCDSVSVSREIFGHNQPAEIPVFPGPTGYVILTSFGFSLLIWGVFHKIPPKLIGNFPEVLSFNPVASQTQLVYL